jgi:hypothetical protein
MQVVDLKAELYKKAEEFERQRHGTAASAPRKVRRTRYAGARKATGVALSAPTRHSRLHGCGPTRGWRRGRRGTSPPPRHWVRLRLTRRPRSPAARDCTSSWSVATSVRGDPCGGVPRRVSDTRLFCATVLTAEQEENVLVDFSRKRRERPDDDPPSPAPTPTAPDAVAHVRTRNG